jgi:hypothetical protein
MTILGNIARFGAQRPTTLSRNYFKTSGLGTLFPLLRCTLPSPKQDIETWLRTRYGLGDIAWQDLSASLQLPNFPLWQIHPSEIFPKPLPPPLQIDALGSALMLARCNAYGYDPESPFVFTRKRLEREIHLIHLSTSCFYGLDTTKY